MSMYVPISAAQQILFDTNKILEFEIFDGDTVGEPVLDGAGRVTSYTNIDDGTASMKDVSGKTLSFTVRKKVGTSTSVIHKTTADDVSVIGVFNAIRATNTQRVRVRIRDTDTYSPSPADPAVNVKAGTYQYALKQTDVDEETVYAYGPLTILKSAAWE